MNAKIVSTYACSISYDIIKDKYLTTKSKIFNYEEFSNILHFQRAEHEKQKREFIAK